MDPAPPEVHPINAMDGIDPSQEEPVVQDLEDAQF